MKRSKEILSKLLSLLKDNGNKETVFRLFALALLIGFSITANVLYNFDRTNNFIEINDSAIPLGLPAAISRQEQVFQQVPVPLGVPISYTETEPGLAPIIKMASETEDRLTVTPVDETIEEQIASIQPLSASIQHTDSTMFLWVIFGIAGALILGGTGVIVLRKYIKP